MSGSYGIVSSPAQKSPGNFVRHWVAAKCESRILILKILRLLGQKQNP